MDGGGSGRSVEPATVGGGSDDVEVDDGGDGSGGAMGRGDGGDVVIGDDVEDGGRGGSGGRGDGGAAVDGRRRGGASVGNDDGRVIISVPRNSLHKVLIQIDICSLSIKFHCQLQRTEIHLENALTIKSRL